MRLVFWADQDTYAKFLKAIEHEIQQAAQDAVKEAAESAVKEGRAQIVAAGFPARAARLLQMRLNPSGDPSAIVFDTMPFASVFERGVTIAGHPLLWLPIEANLPAGVRSPGKSGKKLVSVNVGGKPPMLFEAENRLLGPLFVGVKTATIRKRTDLLRTIAAAAARMQEVFDQKMKELQG